MTTALGTSASRGAVVTVGGQALRLLIQVVGLAVLARQLTPADYGLVAMVVAITGLGEVVRDFGLSHAAVQSKILTRGQRDNLFWTNTGVGLVLTALTFAAAPLIAALYGEPRLTLLSMAVAVTFLLNGLSTQHRASLMRDLRMGAMVLVDTVAPLVALIAAVMVAHFGGGYWALAVQQVLTAAVGLACVWFLARWTPGWIDRSADIRPFLKFGGGVLFTQVLTYASRNIDTVIIGSRFGQGDLGIYNRAFQLLTLPLNQVNAPATRLALPVLSRLDEESDRYAKYIIAGQTILLNVILAVFSFAVAFAGPVVAVALGSQWGAVVETFQILAIAGVFQAAGYALYWVYLSKALTRQLMWWSLVTRPLVIAGVVVGAQWGMTGVAWGYALVTALMWPLGLLWISRISDAPAWQMFTNGLRSLVAYSVVGGAAFLASPLLRTGNDLVDLLVGAALWAAALGIVLLAWPRFRRDFGLLVTVVRKGLKW